MQKGISLNDFKFGTSVGHFPSDSTASTAVKELNKGVGGVGGGHHLMWWVPLCQQCGLKPLLVRLVVVHCWGGKTVNSYQSTFCPKA